MNICLQKLKYEKSLFKLFYISAPPRLRRPAEPLMGKEGERKK